MRRQELLDSLEHGLNQILNQMTAPDDRHLIGMVVKFFILEDASRYTTEELLHRFGTMEQGLSCFLEYLESEKMPATPTIH